MWKIIYNVKLISSMKRIRVRFGGVDVGTIDKYSLDRLGSSGVEIAFDCPQCKRQRIIMDADSGLDFWEGVECRKCHAKIVLGSFSLAIIRENGTPTETEPERNKAFT